MNKKNLLNIFTKDTSYNYHLIKTEIDGHLIYLIKNGDSLTTDSLEFKTTRIVEELISNCGVKIEKIAPGIFFTEENTTEKLKYELNNKISENSEFSLFIDSIKDKYRILEINDSLLYKKDPKAYKEAKQKEREEQQKDLLEKVKKQIEDSNKKREELLLSYDNNLIKLLKDYFDDIIESEKRDFNFNKDFEKIIYSLIDIETWIKIEDKPFSCIIYPLSLEQDNIKVFLTDHTLLYTATLKFDKTKLIVENVVKIETEPKTISDYEFISLLYDINLDIIEEWEFKNESEKIEYIIDMLVPTLTTEKNRKKEELVEKYFKEQLESENEDDEKNS